MIFYYTTNILIIIIILIIISIFCKYIEHSIIEFFQQYPNTTITYSDAHIVNYLNNLDVYIVSSGGVSSNYINFYLKGKGLRVGGHFDLWHFLCHSKKVYSNKVKTIYIYGDYENAIYSQYNRNILKLNMNKMHNSQNDLLEIDHFIRTYPNDPTGYAEQYNNFKNNKNTWMLKYPYTKVELTNTIRSMGFVFPTVDIKIKQRTTKTPKSKNVDLDNIINIYKKYDPYI